MTEPTAVTEDGSGADRWRGPMRRALRLARRGRYRVSPNPMVGCVLLQGTTVVGEGFHRRVGGPHAEVEALRAAGERARGATAVVSLEPCAHQGRTPPCTEALIAAGVARVVIAHRDPNPRVAGRGVERLRAAGIEVVEGPLAAEAARLNLHYLVAHRERRAAVTLKWAMSLDGKIATAGGESQWISSAEGRRWALDLRESHDAILVGIGTALADDPRLTRRLGRAGAPNLRVVLDRRLRLPPESRLFDEPGQVLVYTEKRSSREGGALERRGAEIVPLDRVEPAAVTSDLYRREVHSLLVEGGGTVLAAFFEAGIWDQVSVCCAPLLLGGDAAPGPLGGRGVGSLAAGARLEALETRRCGPDLVITGTRQGCLRDWSSRVAD